MFTTKAPIYQTETINGAIPEVPRQHCIVDLRRSNNYKELLKALIAYVKELKLKEQPVPIAACHFSERERILVESDIRRCGVVDRIDYVSSIDGDVCELHISYTASGNYGRACAFMHSVLEHTIGISTYSKGDGGKGEVACLELLPAIAISRNNSNFKDALKEVEAMVAKVVKKVSDINKDKALPRSEQYLGYELDQWLNTTFPNARRDIHRSIADALPKVAKNNSDLSYLKSKEHFQGSQTVMMCTLELDPVFAHSVGTLFHRTVASFEPVNMLAEVICKSNGLARNTTVTTKCGIPVIACPSLTINPTLEVPEGEEACNAVYSTIRPEFIGSVAEISKSDKDGTFFVQISEVPKPITALVDGIDHRNVRLVPQGVFEECGNGKMRLVVFTHFKLSSKEHAEYELSLMV